jgi:Domain of unknown function (DUF4334)/GXWXG protein
MTDSAAYTTFSALKKRDDQISDAELDDLWRSLRPASIQDVLGEWTGDEFQTGHWGNGGMARIRFYGKTLNSALDAKPLICLDEAGNKFSNVEFAKGEATLWMEEFRGEMTATMVYDAMPTHDHFKVVDDNALLGIMNGKGMLDGGRFLYFWLERV